MYSQRINPNSSTWDTTTLVNRQTLDSAIAGLGAGILNLNNTWTGTNTYNNDIYAQKDFYIGANSSAWNTTLTKG